MIDIIRYMILLIAIVSSCVAVVLVACLLACLLSNLQVNGSLTITDLSSKQWIIRGAADQWG